MKLETIMYNGNEVTIHNNVNVTIDLMEEYSENIYLVGEMGHGNSALVNLVAAWDEGEAVELCEIEDLESVCCIEKIN